MPAPPPLPVPTDPSLAGFARGETSWGALIKRGNRGVKVRRVQEWLTLQGHALAIDEKFGPATELGVRDFQRARGLPESGTVTEETYLALTQPLREALVLPSGSFSTLGETVVALAEQHLARHPREAGGQNMGPWVRLFMDGNQGKEWPWCAGFVSFVVRQAASLLGVPLPFHPTFSCDLLAADAQARGRFLSEKEVAKGDTATLLTPGTIFLNRRSTYDWDHTGIVTEVSGEVIRTIEGNTNDDGDREGYEVCQRSRGLSGKDFVRVD